MGNPFGLVSVARARSLSLMSEVEVIAELRDWRLQL